MADALIIIGRATRAAAWSARRAGFEPWCIDPNPTRDLETLAKVVACPPGEFPLGAVQRISELPVAGATPVLATADLENHPQVLEAVAFVRTLWGSSPQAIRAVRQPQALSDLPAHPGLKYCKVRSSGSLATRAGQWLAALVGGKGYLIKPHGGWRGREVAHWSTSQHVGRDHYLQQYVKGTTISAVFVADGWSAHLVGATEKIVGEPAFGAQGFGYVGAIGPVQLTDKSRRALMHLGVALTQRFDLRGVFGVDGVMDFSGNIWPIEVNPRYTDSVELLERALDVAVISGQTIRGVTSSRRKPPGAGVDSNTKVRGKAIVHARQAIKAPDLSATLGVDVVDVPRVGESIGAGEPICTVFAAGSTRDACMKALCDGAQTVLRESGA